MSKKLILVLAAAVFLSGFNLAKASVVISEIKISPIEDRFIKLYNDGSAAVDLTNWYIQRKTQTGTSFGSLVSKTYFENKQIGANSYFLISRGLPDSDIIIDLTLTESNVVQIKNSAGEVVDKKCWGDVSDCGSVSSPSDQNSDADTDTGKEEEGDNEVQTAKTVKSSSLQAEISSRSVAYTGVAHAFSGKVTKGGQQVHTGRYFWNFGDGDSRQVKVVNTDKFTHTYFYPGEYTVIFEHYPDHFADIPDVSEKINIKVISPQVFISKVGDYKDFFVELSNSTNYEAEISGWVLQSGGKNFSIPKNTAIPANKKMIIPGHVTGFTYGDQSGLKLFSPSGELIFDYSSGAKPAIMKKTPPSPPLDKGRAQSEVYSDALSFPAENLPALVSSSGISGQNSENSLSPLTTTITSALFIGLGAGSVYFIRRKRAVLNSEVGADFEILDE